MGKYTGPARYRGNALWETETGNLIGGSQVSEVWYRLGFPMLGLPRQQVPEPAAPLGGIII